MPRLSETPTHLLIIEPNGTTQHWLLPLGRKADVAEEAMATVTRLFPSWQHELHWGIASGQHWAIVFVRPR